MNESYEKLVDQHGTKVNVEHLCPIDQKLRKLLFFIFNAINRP